MHPLHERRSYESGLPLYATRVRDLEFLAHWHPDVELLYVCAGSISATINQETRLLGEGSLIACGSRDIHYYERSGGGSETILVIFKSELIDHAPLWPASGRLAGHFAVPSDHPGLAAAARRAMNAIVEEMKARKRAFESVARGCILELCGLAEREFGLEPEIGMEARPAAEGGFPALERMQRAIDYIYDRSAYPISLADAAEAASLSPTYFSRVFSKTVGADFRAFLNGIRIERAEELMASGPARLADIALECGFESVRTFNRAYKTLRGRTPSSERKS